jgi:hypothetical protein
MNLRMQQLMKKTKRWKMTKFKTIFLLAGLTLLIVFFYNQRLSRMSIKDMNDILSVDQIKFGLTEAEVIQLWGNGE